MKPPVRTVEEIRAAIADAEANASDLYCMCGDVVTHSAWNAGHTPVSEREYYLGKLNEELAEALQQTKPEACISGQSCPEPLVVDCCNMAADVPILLGAPE